MQRTASQLPLFPDAGPGAAVEPGESPGFSIRESARARRLSIRVYPRGRVEVVVPRRTRAADVQNFVAENRDWIARTRASYADQFAPESFQLPTRITLPAIDRHWVVAYRRRAGHAGVRHRELGDTLVLTGDTDDTEACKRALQSWLRKVAKREFAPRLHALSLAHGLRYRRMQVRAQRTCWGSHSSSGTISLNLCLLFVKPDVLRYLLIHELAHSRHMNHSRAFWKLVRDCEPAYRRLDQALGDAWRTVPGWVGVY